jgi:diacylglycerol kinase family enzyme
MGIIPTGPAHGLARHLEIPLSISKAVTSLFCNHIISIDSGSLNGFPFFCTAGVGFDANLANRFNKAVTRGFPSYFALSAVEYIQHHSEKYKIHVDGKEFEREAFLITFANCSQWGYNICIAPDAVATDGLLDMVIWKKTPVVTFPFMAMRLMMNNIDNSQYIENIRNTSFLVERHHEGWAHVDGEQIQMGREVAVKVHPASLRVVTPCPFQ